MTNDGSSEWLSGVIASNSLGDTEFAGWLHKEISHVSKCPSSASLFFSALVPPLSKRTSRECDEARMNCLVGSLEKPARLRVGKLAWRWAGISG